MYNVIDVRQSYLQKLLKQALLAVGHPEGAARSHHFSYEMVALSHATATELGFAPPAGSEEAKKPFVEVSGRKGLGVKADDLIDRLIAKALAEVTARNADMPAEDAGRVARAIAVAAVRYFLVKFSRGKIIAFDLDEALSFEGESGPYIQYAVVRARNILQKVQERLHVSEADLLGSLEGTPHGELDGANGSHEVWGLILEAARLDDVIEQVIRTLEFSILAKYAFSVAQSFNAFYHRAPIVNEEREDVRRWRAVAVVYVRDQLTRALDLMGIEIPVRGCRRACPVSRSRPASAPWTTTRPCGRPAATPWMPAIGVDDPGRGRWARWTGCCCTGGDDVDPALFGEAPHPTYEVCGARTRRVRAGTAAASPGRRPPRVRDLPRPSGAERRGRRHADPGHSERARRLRAAQRLPAGHAAGA